MFEDNPLFDSTVTVYHCTGTEVQRTVLEGCYFSSEDVLREDELGEHMDRNFQLILPRPEQQLWAGCRVLPGIGPEIGPDEWVQFIPAKVDGLCEAAYARPMYFGGQLSHIEAGRK